VTVSDQLRRLAAALASGAIAVSLVVLFAGACGSSPSGSPGQTSPRGGSPSASAPATSSQLATSAPPAAGSVSPSPTSLPTQSTVEWGRIWDALPPGFPRPAGAVPSDNGDAVSGAFDLSEDVATASGVMQGALEAAGFHMVGVSGPLEDGSIVIDSTGPTPGCRVQTTIVRQGGVTMMTVLYGASCPFD
jgi:hypothetical protein